MWNSLDRDASLHPSSSSSNTTVIVRDTRSLYEEDDLSSFEVTERSKRCVCVIS